MLELQTLENLKTKLGRRPEIKGNKDLKWRRRYGRFCKDSRRPDFAYSHLALNLGVTLSSTRDLYLILFAWLQLASRPGVSKTF